MGWIPCSGTSGTKKKVKKKVEKMQVQDNLVDQIKPAPGTQIFFFWFFPKGGHQWVYDSEDPVCYNCTFT